MNLISEVARLKELAKKEASAKYTQAGDEFGYECQVLNAVPKLLDILGTIRAGDVDALDQVRLWLNDLRLTTMDTGESDYETVTNLIDVLNRYRDMAAKMGAESE